MPSVTRLGDLSTGHSSCYPPRPNIEASGDVFANGISCHRIGDAWFQHGTGDCTPHTGVTSAGSGSVFVNGRSIARIGDPISCGDTIAQGSGDVFAGD
jgi:uncharacterized Zn-binding protein involved in type VI secretion